MFDVVSSVIVVILFFILIFIDCIVLTVNQFARTFPLGEWRLRTIFNGVHIKIQKHLILGRVQTTEQWFLTSTLLPLTWSRSRCILCSSWFFLSLFFFFLFFVVLFCWLYYCCRHCRRYHQYTACISQMKVPLGVSVQSIYLFSIQLFVVWDATKMCLYPSKYAHTHTHIHTRQTCEYIYMYIFSHFCVCQSFVYDWALLSWREKEKCVVCCHRSSKENYVYLLGVHFSMIQFEGI